MLIPVCQSLCRVSSCPAPLVGISFPPKTHSTSSGVWRRRRRRYSSARSSSRRHINERRNTRPTTPLPPLPPLAHPLLWRLRAAPHPPLPPMPPALLLLLPPALPPPLAICRLIDGAVVQSRFFRCVLMLRHSLIFFLIHLCSLVGFADCARRPLRPAVRLCGVFVGRSMRGPHRLRSRQPSPVAMCAVSWHEQMRCRA